MITKKTIYYLLFFMPCISIQGEEIAKDTLSYRNDSVCQQLIIMRISKQKVFFELFFYGN